MVLYHCSVFALLFRFYTTVPFLHYCSVFVTLFRFFTRNNGTKTEQCGIVSLFRFCITVPFFKKILKAKFINVYMQTNGNDCGLYAIANATALAFGRDPSKEQYIPSKLRKHLIQCLEDKEMKPFPTAKGTSKRRKASEKDRKITIILCLQHA